MTNTLQTNTFVGGMNLDTDVTMIPDNHFRYAENVRVITIVQSVHPAIFILTVFFVLITVFLSMRRPSKRAGNLITYVMRYREECSVGMENIRKDVLSG